MKKYNIFQYIKIALGFTEKAKTDVSPVDDFNPPDLLYYADLKQQSVEKKDNNNQLNLANSIYQDYLEELVFGNTKKMEHIKARFLLEIKMELTEWAKDNASDILSICGEYKTGFSNVINKEITPLNNLLHPNGNRSKKNIQLNESFLIKKGYKYLREYEDAKSAKLSGYEIFLVKKKFEEEMEMTITTFLNIMELHKDREKQISIYHSRVEVVNKERQRAKQFYFD